MKAVRASMPYYMRVMNTMFDIMNGLSVELAGTLGGKKTRHRTHKQLNASNSAYEVSILKRLPVLFEQGVHDIETSGGVLTLHKNYFTWQSQHIGSVIAHGVCSLIDEYKVLRPGSSLDLSVLSTDCLEIHFGDMKQRAGQLTVEAATVHDAQSNAMNFKLCECYLKNNRQFARKTRRKQHYKSNVSKCKKEDSENKFKTSVVKNKKN
jgi:hypothetical protein